MTKTKLGLSGLGMVLCLGVGACSGESTATTQDFTQYDRATSEGTVPNSTETPGVDSTSQTPNDSDPASSGSDTNDAGTSGSTEADVQSVCAAYCALLTQKDCQIDNCSSVCTAAVSRYASVSTSCVSEVLSFFECLSTAEGVTCTEGSVDAGSSCRSEEQAVEQACDTTGNSSSSSNSAG